MVKGVVFRVLDWIGPQTVISYESTAALLRSGDTDAAPVEIQGRLLVVDCEETSRKLLGMAEKLSKGALQWVTSTLGRLTGEGLESRSAGTFYVSCLFASLVFVTIYFLTPTFLGTTSWSQGRKPRLSVSRIGSWPVAAYAASTFVKQIQINTPVLLTPPLFSKTGTMYFTEERKEILNCILRESNPRFFYPPDGVGCSMRPPPR